MSGNHLYLMLSVSALGWLAACGPSQEGALMNSSETNAPELAPLVWPKDMERELNEDLRFNIEKIIAAAESKDNSGQHKYSSLTELLQDPLFRAYRADKERAFHLKKVEMGASQALHGYAASNGYPRIMHSTGLTTFTLYTDPREQDAYQSMEIQAVDKETAEVAFYFIDFSSGKPHVERNPRECAGCHQGRAIWQIYNFWPGMKIGRSNIEKHRDLGRNSDIGFTIAQYQTNLARVARQLLSNPNYYPVEKQVVAALIDCPDEHFRFASEEPYRALLEKTREEYYADVTDLIDEVNDSNEFYGLQQRQREYRLRVDGTVDTVTILNEKDPVRIAKLRYLFKGRQVDLDSWSISRGPGGSSILFQSSGGISLSQLAFYLIHNSPNAAELLAAVPQPEDLTYETYPRPGHEVCSKLLD